MEDMYMQMDPSRKSRQRHGGETGDGVDGKDGTWPFVPDVRGAVN